MERQMDDALAPGRCPSPGELLQRELLAREWTQKDLASIIGRPHQAINEIIKGNKQITPETAIELSTAFGASPDYWMNLESQYRLFLAKTTVATDAIIRKRRLYELAPVSELIKRSWIQDTKSISTLEREVFALLGIQDSDSIPEYANMQLRHTRSRDPEKRCLYAWKKRVEALTSNQRVGNFNLEHFSQNHVHELLALSRELESVAEVPQFLLDHGIRFIIVPHLSKTYLDGAMFTAGSPVVALTLRFDRIDAFWFTLLHELAHLVSGHEEAIDTRLENPADSTTEMQADALAGSWLLPTSGFQQIQCKWPYISRGSVEEVASDMGRHPGIVVGRLQHDRLLKYSQFRDYLVRVSPFLSEWIKF